MLGEAASAKTGAQPIRGKELLPNRRVSPKMKLEYH